MSKCNISYNGYLYNWDGDCIDNDYDGYDDVIDPVDRWLEEQFDASYEEDNNDDCNR